jgi:Tol biopolymer transport system component
LTGLSPDSSVAVFSRDNGNDEGVAEIWEVPLADAGEPRPLLQDTFSQGGGSLSPDGRWLAYATLETDQIEVYVQSYPELGAKTMVSVNGGRTPVWSGDSRQLFYATEDGSIMTARIETDAPIRFGEPQEVFDGDYYLRNDSTQFDVGPDGRVLMLK